MFIVQGVNNSAIFNLLLVLLAFSLWATSINSTDDLPVTVAVVELDEWLMLNKLI